MEPTHRLDRELAPTIGYAKQPGRSPTIIFLPGFRSDMTGDKATHLARFCAERGQAMLRFDYSGHGASGGRFQDGTIGSWTKDALFVLDRLTEGETVLVGSSMGGWIALLVALARPERVRAIVGIAAAPDFTERLMWEVMTPTERETLLRDGVLLVPSEYGEPSPITRQLIEDGRNHLLLDQPIPLSCPARLLHGQRDPDVPWETALRITEQISGADVHLTLIKDGDHRLSRPQDLQVMTRTLEPLLG